MNRCKGSLSEGHAERPEELVVNAMPKFSLHTGRSSIMTKLSMICTAALMTAGLVVSTAPKDAPLRIAQAAAQTAPGALSEAQDVNGVAGVVAEIMQCKRDSGVLSIRMRLRNTGDADVSLRVINRANYDQYYVTAGSKKYFILRDSEKTPLANPINTNDGVSVGVTIPKGGTFTWFAKYQAPPADVKKVNYYTPITIPFEDIPITD
jgi:hypothetical protein